MAFKTLDPEDFVVSSDSITATLWSTGTPKLAEFYTSSVQVAGSSGKYYLSVYQTASSLPSSTPQFEIAYADKLGSGSVLFNSSIASKSPSLTTFGQYRTMILEDENSDFIFGSTTNVHTATNFWVINFDRARYKEQLFAGSINLHLSGSNGKVKLVLMINSKRMINLVEKLILHHLIINLNKGHQKIIWEHFWLKDRL